MTRNMNFEKKILSKLEQLKEDRQLAALSRRTGISPANFTRALGNAKQSLGLDKVSLVLEALGAEVVFPGEKEPATYDFEDYTLIPKVRGKLGAGSSLIVDDEPDGLYAFRKEFLTRVGIHGKKDGVLFEIIGDSMIPTFFPDDSVLVAVNQKEIISGKYYAIRINEEIHIKRLETLISGGLRIHSENKDLYPPQDTKKVDDVYIIGRVRWSGRVF